MRNASAVRAEAEQHGDIIVTAHPDESAVACIEKSFSWWSLNPNPNPNLTLTRTLTLSLTRTRTRTRTRTLTRWSLALHAFPRARFLAKTDDDSLNNFANLAAILTNPTLVPRGPGRSVPPPAPAPNPNPNPNTKPNP